MLSISVLFVTFCRDKNFNLHKSEMTRGCQRSRSLVRHVLYLTFSVMEATLFQSFWYWFYLTLLISLP